MAMETRNATRFLARSMPFLACVLLLSSCGSEVPRVNSPPDADPMLAEYERQLREGAGQLGATQRQLEMAQSQLDATERQLAQSQANLERTQVLLDREEALLTRKENVAKRYEALIQRWEGDGLPR